MNVLGAHSLRFVGIARIIYRPDAIRTLVGRYGFVRAPVAANEIYPADGGALVFSHGRLVHENREIPIQNLRVHMDTPQQALTVECSTSTDDSDVVIDDLISTGGGAVVDPGMRRLYQSHIEFTMNKRWLEAQSDLFANTAMSLTNRLARYRGAGEDPEALPPAFRVVAIGMMIDPDQWAGSTDFRIERRANASWGDNSYYSVAPLRTADHIDVINESMERLGQIYADVP